MKFTPEMMQAAIQRGFTQDGSALQSHPTDWAALLNSPFGQTPRAMQEGAWRNNPGYFEQNVKPMLPPEQGAPPPNPNEDPAFLRQLRAMGATGPVGMPGQWPEPQRPMPQAPLTDGLDAGMPPGGILDALTMQRR